MIPLYYPMCHDPARTNLASGPALAACDPAATSTTEQAEVHPMPLLMACIERQLAIGI